MLWLGLGCTILTVSTGLICTMRGAQLHLSTVTYISISRVVFSLFFNSFWHTKLPLSVPFISRFVLVLPLPCFFYDTCCFFHSLSFFTKQCQLSRVWSHKCEVSFWLLFSCASTNGSLLWWWWRCFTVFSFLFCFFVFLFVPGMPKAVCFFCFFFYREVGKTYIEARVRFESFFS